MLATWPCFDGVLATWEHASPEDLVEETYCLAEVALTARSDDLRVLDELTVALGRPTLSTVPVHAVCTLTVRSRRGHGEYGHLVLSLPDGRAHDPDDIRLGSVAEGFPFSVHSAPGESWTVLTFRDQRRPMLALRGPDALFRLIPGWHTAVALLVFNRLIRVRRDAIFFHAASVAIDGRGALLIGGPGLGKSTLSLALAARGHALLGDDTACYLPATRELLPCRRAVGIRPGPRARAVEQALVAAGRRPPSGADEVLRVDVESVVSGPAPGRVPLRAVVLLNGFASEPRLERIQPSPREVGRLQPVVGSLVNAPTAQRVLEMARLLGAVDLYCLRAGDPDLTARLVEETLGAP